MPMGRWQRCAQRRIQSGDVRNGNRDQSLRQGLEYKRLRHHSVSGIEAQLQRRHVLRVVEIDHERRLRPVASRFGAPVRNRRTWRGPRL